MANTACQVSRSTSVHAFLELLEQRKTRRFGCGMELPAGPLQYKSSLPPLPLTAEEERHLIFAGVGKPALTRRTCSFQLVLSPRTVRGWRS